jgi:P2 family phage contractile tail tube protein
MTPKTLKNFAIYVDGYGFLGRAKEVEPPKLKVKTEAYRAGGMDVEIELDQGMEKLELTMTVAEADPKLFGLFGLVQGADKQVTLRQAVQGDGPAEAIVINLRGGIKEIDENKLETGKPNDIKVVFALRYYKRTHAGEVVVEIDSDNMKRIIGGVDVLAEQREALGL